MAVPIKPAQDVSVMQHGGFGAGAALFLATGLVLAVWFAANTYRDTRVSSTVIVRGSMKQEIVSDRIIWRADISATAPDLAGASAQLAENVAAVSKFLKDKGIVEGAETRVVVEPINTMKDYVRDVNGNYTNTLSAYILSQQVRVESNDVDKVETASKEVTKLLGQGIELSSYSPEYIYTKAADLRVALLEKAAQDGRRRAETLAKNAGGELGDLQQATMGVFQILPQYSVDVEDYGANDTSSKHKDAMAVVTLTYTLE